MVSVVVYNFTYQHFKGFYFLQDSNQEIVILTLEKVKFLHYLTVRDMHYLTSQMLWKDS